MKKPIVTTALLMLMCFPAFAQESPETIIKTFFQKYEQMSAGEALAYLYSNNEWMNSAKEAIENQKGALGAMLSDIGNYYGYEHITTKTIGESFVLHSFLVKYDRQPIRFTFEFYKPRDKWKTYAFSFDEDLDYDLEKAARELGK